MNISSHGDAEQRELAKRIARLKSAMEEITTKCFFCAVCPGVAPGALITPSAL